MLLYNILHLTVWIWKVPKLNALPTRIFNLRFLVKVIPWQVLAATPSSSCFSPNSAWLLPRALQDKPALRGLSVGCRGRDAPVPAAPLSTFFSDLGVHRTFSTLVPPCSSLPAQHSALYYALKRGEAPLGHPEVISNKKVLFSTVSLGKTLELYNMLKRAYLLYQHVYGALKC